MALLPKVKLKAIVSFPAVIKDGIGIDVLKENGSYQFDIAFNDFAPPVGGLTDPAHQCALLWNSLTNSYVLVPVSVLGSGGAVVEAPNDGVQYGRKNLAWTPIAAGLADAPNDGQQYGRQGLAWTLVPPVAVPSNANPIIEGVAAPGVSSLYARADHVHPLSGSGRTKLTSNTTWYVNPVSGNDANDGLTVGLPKRTINAAYANIKQNFDCDGNIPEIKCAAGTYNEQLNIIGHLVGAHYVTLTGDVANPNNCILQGPANSTLVYAKDFGYLKIQGWLLQSAAGATGVFALVAEQFAGIDIAGPTSCGSLPGGRGVSAAAFGTVNVEAPLYFVGNTNFALISQNGGRIQHSNQIIVPGPIAVNTFAWADGAGGIYVSGGTITGAGAGGATTGTKYFANTNATIITNGGGANFFPGNVAGSVNLGGVYA